MLLLSILIASVLFFVGIFVAMILQIIYIQVLLSTVQTKDPYIDKLLKEVKPGIVDAKNNVLI
jgi:hypothetical protein